LRSQRLWASASAGTVLFLILGLTVGLLVFLFGYSHASGQGKLMVTAWLLVTSALAMVGTTRLVFLNRLRRPTDDLALMFLFASFLASIAGILVTGLSLVYIGLTFVNLIIGWLGVGR